MKWVDIDLLEEPLHMLRSVNTESEDFKSLLASMEADGFWESEPIDVSEDASGASAVYVVNDGMHRLTAAKLLGLKQVPVSVCTKELTDSERLERSMIANAARVKTKPVEYARALAKIVEVNDGITMVDLARRARRDVKWVTQLLKLAPLPAEVSELVDSGKIPLANAQALATVQKAGLVFDGPLIMKAQREGVEAFAQEAVAYITEHTKGKKPAKKAPAAKLRPLPDVKAELERAKADKNSPPGYLEALTWTLRQDPVSAAVEGATPVEREAIASVALDGDTQSCADCHRLSKDLHELIHWARGSGADCGEVVDQLSPATAQAIDDCDTEILKAIEAIGVKTLEAKLKTNSVSRWLKRERQPSYAARRVILETIKDPIYAKQIRKD